MADKQITKGGADIIGSLDNVFKQAPKLPENIREVLVKIAPWLALIFGILGIVAGLGAVGLSPLALMGGVDSGTLVLISGVVSIVASALMLMAYPKLTKRQYKGWELLFWSEVVSAVSAVLAISVGSILGVIIGFYILFQIKDHYK